MSEMVRSKIQFIEHHRSHLASAFFSSPFDEAAVLSIDGSGDFTTTMLARGKGTDIEVLRKRGLPGECRSVLYRHSHSTWVSLTTVMSTK